MNGCYTVIEPLVDVLYTHQEIDIHGCKSIRVAEFQKTRLLLFLKRCVYVRA
jgi:hypothetical protein